MLIQLPKKQMKNRLATTLLACILYLFSHSQDIIKQTPCNNEDIKAQADSVKRVYADLGFILIKEASISMESEYEIPVIVPLTKGSWYQFVFIGDKTSKLFEVRMFDWNEKQVVYEKNRNSDINGNVISYSFIPQISEFHMMKPVQVNKKKKKDVCGYVMLMKKVK